MTDDLKAFIEENIELIDTEDWLSLLESTILPTYELSNGEISELINILTSIGADLTETREELLYKWMNEGLCILSASEGQISIFGFLRRYFTNWLGYSQTDLIDYIINNQEGFGIYIKGDSDMPRHNHIILTYNY